MTIWMSVVLERIDVGENEMKPFHYEVLGTVRHFSTLEYEDGSHRNARLLLVA